MGVREDWRNSKEIINTERGDERSRHQRLLVMRDTLVALVAVALAYTGFLELWPLSDTTRLRAYSAFPAVLFLVGLLAVNVSARKHRPYSPEFQRAAQLRSLTWWPLGAVVVGAVAYLLHPRQSEVFGVTIGFVIGGVLVAAVALWRSRRSDESGR